MGLQWPPRRRKATEDEPRPSCHHCGVVIVNGRCVIYRGPLITRGMGITYCTTDCLLDDIDIIEGREPKRRRLL